MSHWPGTLAVGSVTMVATYAGLEALEYLLGTQAAILIGGLTVAGSIAAVAYFRTRRD